MTPEIEFHRITNEKSPTDKIYITYVTEPYRLEKHNTYFYSLDLTECSGNGKPVILPRCEAECECFGGWEGEYCERISANGGGDPHLETLDGKRQQVWLASDHSPFLH